MAQEKNITNYAELVAGFLERLNSASPLFKQALKHWQGEPPPIVLLHLTRPEKKIKIHIGEEPTVSVINGESPEAEMNVTMDAEMAHYLLWGRLTIAKAINEKLMLVDNNKSSSPEKNPPMLKAGEPLMFNNFVYEMYLIRRGAERLLEQYKTLIIPEPGQEGPPQEIELVPVPPRGILAFAANLGGRILGLLAGPIVSYLIKRQPEDDLEAPLEFSEGLKPGQTPPGPSSGIRLAIMKALFRRIDVFDVLENIVKGIMTTGRF